MSNKLHNYSPDGEWESAPQGRVKPDRASPVPRSGVALNGVLRDGTKPCEKKKEKLACHSLSEGAAIYTRV